MYGPETVWHREEAMKIPAPSHASDTATRGCSTSTSQPSSESDHTLMVSDLEKIQRADGPTKILRRRFGSCALWLTLGAALSIAIFAAVIGVLASKYVDAEQRIGTFNPSSNCTTIVGEGTDTFTASTAAWVSQNELQVFKLHCNTDYIGFGLINVLVADFQTCMNACAAYNARYAAHNGSLCRGATFMYESQDPSAPNGSCCLKNRTDIATSSYKSMDAGILSQYAPGGHRALL